MREEAGGIGGRDTADAGYSAGSPARDPLAGDPFARDPFVEDRRREAGHGADRAAGSSAPRPADRLVLIGAPRAGLSLLAEIAGQHGWRDQRQTEVLETLAADAGSLPAGSCLIGAIPHAEAAIAALAGFRKLLVIRELRSTLTSALRLERQLRRWPHLTPVWQLPTDELQMSRFLQQHGSFLFGQFLSVISWLTEPDVVTLRFERLRQPDAALAARLAMLLRRDAGKSGHEFTAPAAAMNSNRHPVVARRSGEAGDFRSFWSDEAELLFTAFGGCQLNKALGYDLASGTDDHAAH
ncbi:MAG TPA: hypothetical protein VND94_15715 [Terriglobia bacterium]|nr:hypothetical protein [Terriglobia bacterium]